MLADLSWFWDQMPPQLSTYAHKVDWTYYFIYYWSAFFFVLIMAFMAYFCVKYRRKHPSDKMQHAATHNNVLETAWSVIPSVIFVYMFYDGFVGFMDIRTLPEPEFEVSVSAQKWFWSFSYENGKAIESGQVDANANWHDRADVMKSVPKLHVPVNKDVVLTMSSKDVIHSFYIPVFRVKQDVVPGRYTKVWFNAVETGTYDILCTEYCGDKHSEMLAQVVVESQEDFDKWYAVASNPLERLGGDYVKYGEELYRTRGCVQCHSVDGSPRANGGPSFLGSYGKQVDIDGEGTTLMDENYIRESIQYPQKKIRKGFGKIMSAGLLRKDEEFEAIIAYIKDLNKNQEN